MESTAFESGPRRRLLLIAYACSPDHGSEPGVGWNRALQAARFHDTWVICEERRFGPEIRRHLRDHGPVPGLHFQFLPMNGLEHGLARTRVLYYQAYNLWHRRAARLAARLHARLGFDLVHQVNYCGFREPGYGWRLDAPFVWGPVGGAQNLPWRFLGELGPVGAGKEVARTAINQLHLHYRTRVRRALGRAEVVLCANETNRRALEAAHGVPCEVLLETGLARVPGRLPVASPAAAGKDQPDAFRVVWAGQLLPFKGLSLLLKALGQLSASSRIQVSVLGEGPRQRAWQRLARRAGVEHRVQWRGWLPHPRVLEEYRRADVMVFTSLRDTTGSVILEGLAAGLPLVCLNHQGAREVVTTECGMLIEPGNPRQVVAELREALLRLERDATLRQRLSEGAVRRARQLLWDINGERMERVYRRVLANRETTASERSGSDGEHDVARELAVAVPTPGPPHLADREVP